MTFKLIFLDDLLSTPRGQEIFELYAMDQHLHQSNLSEVLLLKLNDHGYENKTHQKDDSDKLILKVVHKSFGCTLKPAMYDPIHYLPPMGALYHGSIAQIVDYFETDNYIYIIKRFYEGTDLQTLVDQHGPLALNVTLDIAVSILDALGVLHNHNPAIIVRDLKPANVILTPSCVPVLVDLESARAISKSHQGLQHKNDTVILGTPGYAAPEQYGIQETNEKSDFYSLGMLLYFLLTGEIKKHQEWHPILLAADFQFVRACIEKATAFDPSGRYESISHFKSDLIASQNKSLVGKHFNRPTFLLPLLLLAALLIPMSFLVGYNFNKAQRALAMGPTQLSPTHLSPTLEQTETSAPNQDSNQQTSVDYQPQIFIKGTRTALTTTIDDQSEPRDLPFGIVQRVEGSDFSTSLVLSKLPETLKHVDAIGVGGDINSFEKIKADIDGMFDRGEDPYREYAAFGSDVIIFRSVGAYYHGHHVDLYEGKRLRAIITVGIDNTIAYIIYP